MAISSRDQLTKTERDARLEALKSATEQWGQKETKRLEDDAAFLKSVLKRRSSAGQLAASGVEKAKDYLVQRISQFLEG